MVSDLVLVVGFVFGFSGSTLRPLDLLPLQSITHIFGLGFGFCYWVFFHLSLFVLGVCVDGGKQIGLLLVLLKMD